MGGTARSGEAEFQWDQQRRAAVRTRLRMQDGPTAAEVLGPRPWSGQVGAELAKELAPDLYRVLDRIYYLGPMRSRAHRTTVVGQGQHDYVGPTGERMAEILYDRPELLEQVNEWCDRLGMGYRVRLLTPVSHDIVISAGGFAALALEDVRHDPPVLVSSRAVGYGVGQLLPLIVQCLAVEDGVILIEEQAFRGSIRPPRGGWLGKS